MFRTGTAVRGFVVTLVTGILATTFLPLGIAFAIIGSVSEPAAFKPLGLIFIGLGAVLAVVALLARRTAKRRDAEEAAARTSRTTAQVIEASLNPYSRVGTLNPMKLAVSLSGERRARTVYVPPTTNWQPGMEIEVAYAPMDPDNFVPVQPLGA
jgi:uncharacterized membrane protein YccC